MRPLTLQSLAAQLDGARPPCLSVYLPTHRSGPDKASDPQRYKRLLRTLEESLLRRTTAREAAALLAPFAKLLDNDLFWVRRTEGLAAMGSKDGFELFELQRPVPELAVVADSFHVKPLLRMVQSADRFQVLALTLDRAWLLEGNRDALDAIESPKVPGTLDLALGPEVTEPQSGVTAFARVPGGAASGGPRGREAVFHGQGGRKDSLPIDRERYFRVIDRAVLEHHSQPTGLPLLLAALPEHQGHFRALSRNPFLAPQGLALDPAAADAATLRAEAWKLVEPLYLARLARCVDEYHLACSRKLGSDRLPEIAQAALAGRVSRLLVEADRQVPGRLEGKDGAISHASPGDPSADDVLDDLAELVLRRKGEVIVVPARRMPCASGAAATFRF